MGRATTVTHPNSHVLSALIRRFHEAFERGDASVACWGNSVPMREFLHVDDLGEGCVFALAHWQPRPDEQQFFNVGTGVDLSILELAQAVAAATGFQGEIHWDTSNPDGTPKKLLDVSRLAELGWRERIPFAEGLASTVVLLREQLSLHLARF
jgi:GDP-L-fucose synthase